MTTPTEFKVILSGFKTKEQAVAFLKWFEGGGEQDDGLAIYMERVGVKYVNCDVQTGMIDHADGVEYKVDLTNLGDEDE